jgi:hypothetical protein
MLEDVVESWDRPEPLEQVPRALATMEGTLTRLDSGFDGVAEARHFALTALTDYSPDLPSSPSRVDTRAVTDEFTVATHAASPAAPHRSKLCVVGDRASTEEARAAPTAERGGT